MNWVMKPGNCQCSEEARFPIMFIYIRRQYFNMHPISPKAPVEADWDFLRQKKPRISLEHIESIAELSAAYLQPEAAEFSEDGLIASLRALYERSKGQNAKMSKKHARQIERIVMHSFSKFNDEKTAYKRDGKSAQDSTMLFRRSKSGGEMIGDATLQISTKPLIGPALIDFESVGSRLSKEQIEQVKSDYVDLVNNAVDSLRELGFGRIRTKEELKLLCAEALSIIWSNFVYEHLALVCDGFSKKMLGGDSNVLDCDTSSQVLADILRQFDVESKLVGVPRHAILRPMLGKASFYVETTTGKDGVDSVVFLANTKKVLNKYGIILGECGFSEENSAAFFARACARKNNGDIEGAIGDFKETIRRNPLKLTAYTTLFELLPDLKSKIGIMQAAAAIAEKELAKMPGNAKLVEFIGDMYSSFGIGIRGSPADSDWTTRLQYSKEAVSNQIRVLEMAMGAKAKNKKFAKSLASAISSRGGLKEELGDSKGALEDFEKAASLDSFNLFHCIDLRIKLGDYEGALADANRQVRREPKSHNYLTRARINAMKGDGKGAYDDARKTISRWEKESIDSANSLLDLLGEEKITDRPKYDASCSEALTIIASYQLSRGDIKGALKSCELAFEGLRFLPDDKSAAFFSTLATAQHRSGKHDEALNNFSKAALHFEMAIEKKPEKTDLLPKLADSYEQMSKTYLILGNEGRAQEFHQKSINILQLK